MTNKLVITIVTFILITLTGIVYASERRTIIIAGEKVLGFSR